MLLGGCATGERLGSVDEPAYSGMVSAREYGYVRPAVDVWVMERATAERAVPNKRADRNGGSDIWERVRSGMRLDLHADARIDSTVERFRRSPQYLTRLAERATPYLHVIVNEIERRGLPMELAFLPHVESRYTPTATSPKSAAGIWQFMPYTGLEMGLRQNSWYDGRRDLLASTSAALDYLERLNRRFDGDWALAMAAYNCGPGCVASAQAANRRNGRPTDYWSLSLPNETRQYVPQILATARLVAEPAKYGLNLPRLPDRPQLEIVRGRQPLDLQRIAAATGVQLSELQRLNPGLKLGRTAPDGPYHVLIPAGTGQRIGRKMEPVQVMPAMAVLAASSRTPAKSSPTQMTVRRTQIHTVKGGETLASIARTHNIEPSELAEANGLSAGEPVLVGQILRIEQQSTELPISHLVAKGDSIKKLARRYGVTVKDIQRWNQLEENRLKPGDLILIYPPGSRPTS